MSANTHQTEGETAGLTPEEAEARLNQFGPNEPAVAKQHSLLSDLLHSFTNPLVWILVIAAVLSAFMGEGMVNVQLVDRQTFQAD